MALNSRVVTFANGRCWVIRPADEPAARALDELGRIMRLKLGGEGRELLVTTCRERPDTPVGLAGEGAVVCCIPLPLNRELEVIQLERIAASIACESLAGGALLLHGALAEHHGDGAILAGPGAVGKSTASRRLPAPWRSLCDDATLVVRDGRGDYWAHPWPTWSLFRNNGRGGSWSVEDAVPLKAICFLAQSPDDRLEPVSAVQATALLLESAAGLARTVTLRPGADATYRLLRRGVTAAKLLASVVPAYSLRLSLHGEFWKEIERVLPRQEPGRPLAVDRVESPESLASMSLSSNAGIPGDRDAELHLSLDNGLLRRVYAGPSMNPTLREPDIIEVRPYRGRPPQAGDVVCFKPPGKTGDVVHRVFRVEPDGMRTRGDNNPQTDPWVLQPQDVIGQVVAAQHGTQRREIKGGKQGVRIAAWAQLRRVTWNRVGQIPHRLYECAVGLGPFESFLPTSLRPRLVRFEARCRAFLKLKIGGLTIGRHDGLHQKWNIRRPFRLFVGDDVLREISSLIPPPNNNAVEVQTSAAASGAPPGSRSDRAERVFSGEGATTKPRSHEE